jgi:bacillolysin
MSSAKPGARLSAREIPQLALEILAQNKPVFLIENPSRDLRDVSSHQDKMGRHHVKFERQIAGVPVWGEDLLMHLDGSGVMYAFNGNYGLSRPATSDARPTVTESEAIDRVRSELTKLTAIHDLSDQVKELLGYEGPMVSLCYWPDSHTEELALAWRVDIRPNMTDNFSYFVDASSGQILDHYNQSASDGSARAVALDLTGTSRLLEVYEVAGEYFMFDAIRNTASSFQPAALWSPIGGLVTASSYFNDVEVGMDHVFSRDNTWTDPLAVSAHANLATAYDYFRNTHGRIGIDGRGSTVYSIIHVTENGLRSDNALWNGRVMIFGDGVRNAPYAAALDVVAHEMTHGIIDHTVALVYRGQSGAINESIADVFAAMVDRDDWTMAELIVNLSDYPSGAMRDLSSPHNGGTSQAFYWQPAHMSEFVQLPDNSDNGGVHINSGIPNHAYYLLAQDIGKEKAEKIYYRILDARYLVSRATFEDLRRAAEQAARDLFGTSSSEVRSVSAAFAAVGIGAGPGYEFPDPREPIEGDDWILVVNDSADGDASLYLVADQLDSAEDIVQLTRTQVNSSSSSPVTVSSDGSFVLFVDNEFNLRFIWSDGTGEEIFDASGTWWSISLSPDGTKLAATSTLDATILIYDLVDSDASKEITLYQPTTQSGVTTSTVEYADALDWDVEGEYLIYDAFNRVAQAGGNALEYWNVNLLNPDSELIIPLLPPQPTGYQYGNPNFASTTSRYVVFDYLDQWTEQNSITLYDLGTGSHAFIATTTEPAAPRFSPDDTELAYGYTADDGSRNVARISVSLERLGATDEPTGFLSAAQSPEWLRIATQAVDLPVAAISQSYIEGEAPLTVSVQDRSTGLVESRTWRFDDGTTTTGPSISRTFSQPGTYTIALVVGNSAGSSTAELTVVVVQTPVLDTRAHDLAGGCWTPDAGDVCTDEEHWRFTGSREQGGSLLVNGLYEGVWTNRTSVGFEASYEFHLLNATGDEIVGIQQHAVTLDPEESVRISEAFSFRVSDMERANEISELQVWASFTQKTLSSGLITRVVSGTSRRSSPARVRVNSRVNFEVMRYTEPDSSDSVAISNFDMKVPPQIGEASGDAQVRVTRMAGVSGVVRFESGGEAASFILESTPSSIVSLNIHPESVRLQPGDKIDFGVEGVDRFGNTFPPAGVAVGWHVVPSDIGEINPRTGLFTAGALPDQGYIIAVVSRSLRFGDTEANVTGSGKILVGEPMPTSFVLHQNYPNPFNPGTRISFGLPLPSKVSLSVYNVSGQIVERIINTSMPAGTHTVSWSPAGLPSGTYLYRLETELFSETKRMMMLE